MLRKLLSVIVIGAMILFCSAAEFTSVDVEISKSSPDSSVINAGEDIVIQYDDKGIYHLIQSIQDPVKKAMIMDYWYTPAFYTTAEIDMQNQKALSDGLETVKMLIDTPTQDLEAAINQLLQEDIDHLAKDVNAKIVPSFIKHLEGKPIKNVTKLTKKVGNDIGATVTIDASLDSSSSIAAASSIVNSSVTANYTVGNSGSLGYLMINCKVTYKRNTSTYEITSLTQTTTTGYFYPNYVGDGYDFSEQGIINGYPDRGYVHKSKSVWNIINGQASSFLSGYLVADVVVRGNGIVAKKYANNITVQLYKNYCWSY